MRSRVSRRSGSVGRKELFKRREEGKEEFKDFGGRYLYRTRRYQTKETRVSSGVTSRRFFQQHPPPLHPPIRCGATRRDAIEYVFFHRSSTSCAPSRRSRSRGAPSGYSDRSGCRRRRRRRRGSASFRCGHWVGTWRWGRFFCSHSEEEWLRHLQPSPGKWRVVHGVSQRLVITRTDDDNDDDDYDDERRRHRRRRRRESPWVRCRRCRGGVGFEPRGGEEANG